MIRRILSIILICSMLGISGCSMITGTGTIQTADGDILSRPLTETIKFLKKIKNVYILIGTTAGNKYDSDKDKDTSKMSAEEIRNLMTDEKYDKILNYADEFKIKYDNVVLEVVKWYEIEDSMAKLSNKDAIVSLLTALNVTLLEFVDLLEDVGVKPEEIETIKASIILLNNIYDIGGAK